MMRHVVLALLCVVFAGGCRSNCRALSERQCECTLTTSERTVCLASVASREANNPPTPEDEDACEALVDECDCNLIDTPEGKRNCGIAR